MKAYVHTFGCRANQYDGEVVRGALAAAGVELVGDVERADVAVFNSCAVTAEAEADLRQAVRRAARRNARVRTIVTGCAAATDRGAIAALPSVTRVIGGADITAVLEAAGVADASVLAAPPAVQSGARAMLRIQDGCDEHCTFCITTVARGRNRSRPADEIVAEAARLAAYHPEIVITGIHIGSYGADCGSSLGALMRRLVREVPDVRFRLSSLEATEVDDALRLLYDTPRRVAPYLHAPLQSGSDAVLRRMGRHWYTAATYAEAVERLVAGRPVFGLSADVIAGFPGETEDDHRATLALVERLPFTALHVFPFSLRPDTPAERLGGQVPAPVITRRARELRDLAAAKGAMYRRRRAGTSADVVTVGSGSRRSGVTEDYLTIPVDPMIPRGVRFTGVIPP